MIAVCIVGVLASVASPAYTRFLMASKSAESYTNLAQIFKGSVAYWEREHGG